MIFSIALNVGAYFLFPKFRIVLWPHKIVTALMPVPETTVYKDHSLIFGKNNIRFSWKPSVIFSVSESLRKQVFSDIGHNNPPFQLVFVVVFQFLTTYSHNRSFIGSVNCAPDVWRNRKYMRVFVIKEKAALY